MLRTYDRSMSPPIVARGDNRVTEQNSDKNFQPVVVTSSEVLPTTAHVSSTSNSGSGEIVAVAVAIGSTAQTARTPNEVIGQRRQRVRAP